MSQTIDGARLTLLLNDLRLPAIKQGWAAFAERADKEGWPAARFLAALAEHEIAERDRRRIERHLVEARLLPGKTFDAFEFDAVPMVSKAHVMAICAGDSWIDKGANLILIGVLSELPERTAHGYRRFRCHACGKQFNERSTGALNRTQYPSDVVALVVLWRLRYKLSLRDLAEMFLLRGIVFSYEAVRGWEAKLTPALAENLRRRRRRGKIGRSWYVDETYVKVQGRWCYLYRATDTSGALVDVRLSETRDMAAAKAFFQSAKTVTGI